MTKSTKTTDNSNKRCLQAVQDIAKNKIKTKVSKRLTQEMS